MILLLFGEIRTYLLIRIRYVDEVMRRPNLHLLLFLLFVFSLLFSACDLFDVPGNDSDQSYTLTVALQGSGSGSVASDPGGINCGDDCDGMFQEDSRVTLSAEAEAGSTFAGWSDSSCADSGTTCEIEIASDKTINATFNVQGTSDRPQLNVEVVGSGTVTSEPGGINCGSDCEEAYANGTSVTLSAAPGDGSKFVSWSAPGCAGTSCEVALDADTTVTATFAPQDTATYPLSVQLSGEGGGTVTSEPGGINCGSDCEETFLEQTKVTLTAEPEDGSVFAGWTGACEGESCEVTMSEARRVTARFDPNETPAGAPTITSFSADRTEITAGESVTLSWQVEGAKSFVLEPVGQVESSASSFADTPDKTTTYILKATNDAGTTSSESVEVTVNPSPTLPRITSFSAAPGEIDAGQSATLSWTVTGDGPIEVSIDNGGGTFTGSGDTTVSPSGTTTYTLTASNSAGSVDDSATVTVRAEPPPPSDGKITLLIAGQSNASSRGLLENVEASIPQVRMLGNDGAWKQAAEPTDSNENQVDDVSRDEGIGLKFGAGHSFGVKLGKDLNRASGQNVYLIQSAKAGSCVDRPCSFPVWDPSSLDSETLFGNAVRRAKLSAGNNGEGGPVTGIVWYQGESDQNNSEFVQDTKAVMNGFRRELNDSDLPIIYVQLARRMEKAASNRAYQGVREKQRTMEADFGTSGNELDNFYMVVAHDLPMIQPNHVATEGQKILGQRIALAYREHVLGQNVDGTGPRLESLSRSGNVVTVMTNQRINNNSDYDNYFTVSVNGSEKALGNGIARLERDSSGRGVRITLSDTPPAGADVNVRYMPPSDRPDNVECREFCDNETDFNYGPVPPQLRNVVKNDAGLPLPAFGYLDVN